MKIGDLIYKSCSLDILEFKVIAIKDTEVGKFLELKSTHTIGACGVVTVLVSAMDKLFYADTIAVTYGSEHQRGLDIFVEGEYHTTKDGARVSFYEAQRTTAWSSMENKRRIYEESKSQFQRIEKILKEIREANKG